MPKRARRTRALPANHLLVYEALKKAGEPVSAYHLLMELRDQGVTAPPTVYRALKRLTEEGRVHRIESLNAYVVCATGCAQPRGAGFAICDDCGSVTEFPCSDIERSVETWASEMAFTVGKVMLELHGRCADCSGSSAGVSG